MPYLEIMALFLLHLRQFFDSSLFYYMILSLSLLAKNLQNFPLFVLYASSCLGWDYEFRELEMYISPHYIRKCILLVLLNTGKINTDRLDNTWSLILLQSKFLVFFWCIIFIRTMSLDTFYT